MYALQPQNMDGQMKSQGGTEDIHLLAQPTALYRTHTREAISPNAQSPPKSFRQS